MTPVSGDGVGKFVFELGLVHCLFHHQFSKVFMEPSQPILVYRDLVMQELFALGAFVDRFAQG